MTTSSMRVISLYLPSCLCHDSVFGTSILLNTQAILIRFCFIISLKAVCVFRTRLHVVQKDRTLKLHPNFHSTAIVHFIVNNLFIDAVSGNKRRSWLRMTSVFGQLSRSRLAAFFIIGRQRLEMKKVGVLCDVARLSMEVFCSQKNNMFCAFVETVSSSRSRRNHFARVVCRANFCCIKLFSFSFFFWGGGGGREGRG